MANYPVLDGAGATIIANEKDPAYDVDANYPVLDGASGEIVERHRDLRLDYGDNLISNSSFDSADGWLLSAEATIADGKARVLSSAGNYQYVGQASLTVEAGKTYGVFTEVTERVSGQLRVNHTRFTAASVPTSVGEHVVDVVAASSGTATVYWERVAGVTDVTVARVAIREKL